MRVYHVHELSNASEDFEKSERWSDRPKIGRTQEIIEKACRKIVTGAQLVRLD